jgi:predicted small lipoprotein YifL
MKFNVEHFFLLLLVMFGLVACEKKPPLQTPSASTEISPTYAGDNRPKVQIAISYPGHDGMPKMDVCAKSIGTQEEECIKLAEGNSSFDVIMYLDPDKYIFYMKEYWDHWKGKGPARITYHTNTFTAYENISVFGITKIQTVDVNAHSRHVIQFDFYNTIGERAKTPTPNPNCYDPNVPECYGPILNLNNGIPQRKLD